MSVFEFGEWKIEIDEEKTKEYYAGLPIPNNQASRNFRENIKNMTQNEKLFFDSLCVDAKKLKISAAMGRKKNWSCYGDIYVFGEFISYPKEEIVTLDDVAQNDIDILYNENDTMICIDSFEFDIQSPEFWEPGEDTPNGAVCIDFYCESLAWLLNEKCEDIYESSIIAEFFKRSLMFIIRPIYEHNELKTIKKKIAEQFNNLGIAFEIMSKKEIMSYKRKWVNNFAPIHSDKNEIEKLCVKNRKYNTYLWHIFSFEFLKGEEKARYKFNYEDKSDCVIIFNCANLGFRIKNAEKLTAEFIDNTNEFDDITVTASDFSWTYSKTHEDDWCTPYFYRKDDNND